MRSATDARMAFHAGGVLTKFPNYSSGGPAPHLGLVRYRTRDDAALNSMPTSDALCSVWQHIWQQMLVLIDK